MTISTRQVLAEILLDAASLLAASSAALYLVASIMGTPSKQQEQWLGESCLVYFPSLAIALACKAYKRPTAYQVAYEGQLITDPLDYALALAVAVEENIDATQHGHLPLAEVVIALGGSK